MLAPDTDYGRACEWPRWKQKEYSSASLRKKRKERQFADSRALAGSSGRPFQVTVCATESPVIARHSRPFAQPRDHRVTAIGHLDRAPSRPAGSAR